MTAEQEKNIAIAEACGWSDIKQGPYDAQPFGRHKAHELLPLPCYLNDLNAMHEAEKVLTTDQLNRYADIMCNAVASDDPDPNIAGLLLLTAAQRAEAFLKTLDK